MLLSIWLVLAPKFESVGIEVVSIMGWVCIWEAATIAFMERPELTRELFNLELLLRSEIVVQTEKESPKSE